MAEKSAEKHEGKGGKILSMTVKRARRVQEKMMQKMGKSDQTRDEVFEEFVNNFRKQNACAVKLQKEMTKYMNNIRVLYQNTKSLSETLKELYEDDWEGCEKQRDLMEQRILLWEDLLTSLTSRTVEPMTNYISRFADIKGRIHKRERKVVDYDLRRRELEHSKAKVKVNDQKIQQAEESYTQAKQLYDEITDELYEELPTFYDSRIQFYAQIFQSIAASEAKFHTEVSKIDEDLAIVMDGLASQAATGVHSTKKQRNVLAAAPKLLSRPVDEESDDDSGDDIESGPSQSPSLTQSHTSPIPVSDLTENSVEPDASPPSTHTPSEQGRPSTPPPFRSPDVNLPPTVDGDKNGDHEPQNNAVEDTSTVQNPTTEDVSLPDDNREDVLSPLKTPPPKPAPLDPSPVQDTLNAQRLEGAEEEKLSKKVPPPDDLLYTVLATHQYAGEDEDELSFDKGAVIYVVPYEDPEDEEDGWRMGILQESGDKGIFPENFTKRQD